MGVIRDNARLTRHGAAASHGTAIFFSPPARSVANSGAGRNHFGKCLDQLLHRRLQSSWNMSGTWFWITSFYIRNRWSLLFVETRASICPRRGGCQHYFEKGETFVRPWCWDMRRSLYCASNYLNFLGVGIGSMIIKFRIELDSFAFIFVCWNCFWLMSRWVISSLIWITRKYIVSNVILCNFCLYM